MTWLRIISGVMLAIAAGGLAVAVYYVRAAIKAQRAALATLDEVRTTYLLLSARLLVTPPGGRLSFMCRVYGAKPHEPCSGTTDDGTDSLCACWCHVPVTILGPRGSRT